MIDHPAFREIDPWCVCENGLDLAILAQSESIFALSNGHIGMRANLDEGEPHGMPGTYLNGFYQTRDLPYPETAFGNPETADSIVNVTNGKVIRLLVDDQPFDVRYGRLLSHRRILDFRTGILERTAEWESPAGSSVRIRSSRLVSLQQRAVAAIRYEIRPVTEHVHVALQSELVTNEVLPDWGTVPNAARRSDAPFTSELAVARGSRVVMVHSLPGSGLRLAAAMDHQVLGPKNLAWSSEADRDLGRVTITARLRRNQPLVLTKFLAYGWSSTRSKPALRDQAEGALAEAVRTGWGGLARSQQKHLAAVWARSDIQIEGDPALQQALRFAHFHVVQASARTEGRPIPAKGLSGPGYDGHTFWDMDTFVLHMLSYTLPELVRAPLAWRHSTLALARDRARLLRLNGAAFPWRTIRGTECSGYWPAGIAAFHINADVADAVIRYCEATGDREFERTIGVDLLIETARLWRSLGAFNAKGQFRIDGVTGPNEYNALADNNLYTNLMAQHNLRAAAAAVKRFPTQSRTLDVGPSEIEGWIRAADAIIVPYDPTLKMPTESENSTQHQRWDFTTTSADRYPLFLHVPYFHLYRRQIVKQADAILALHLRGEGFTADERRRAFEYYEALTVRDSSLSAGTQAVMAAEAGHVSLAYDYLAESALIDLDDVDHNVRDGVHIASLAGSWIAAVAGLGGMRVERSKLRFAPRLPRGLARLSFRLTFHGSLLQVDVLRDRARYRVLAGPPIAIAHHAERIRVGRTPRDAPIPTLPDLPPPIQPVGRSPLHRSPGSIRLGRRTKRKGGSKATRHRARERTGLMHGRELTASADIPAGRSLVKN